MHDNGKSFFKVVTSIYNLLAMHGKSLWLTITVANNYPS